MLAYCRLDRGVNTFSPEGRLFQGMYHARRNRFTILIVIEQTVEYAIEAIKVHTLLLSRWDISGAHVFSSLDRQQWEYVPQKASS